MAKDNTGFRKDPITNRKFKTKMRRKLVWLFIIVILAFVVLAIDITRINATQGDAYRKKVLSQSQQQYSSKTLPFKRGDILDRNGMVLATSEKVYNLILDCKVVNRNDGKYRQATMEKILEFFPAVKESELQNRLLSEDSRNSQYQILLKEVTIEEKKAYEDYCDPDDETRKTLSKEERTARYQLKGVWFEETYKRVYPFNSLACDVIGFTYDGTTADWGIEGYYGNTLNGTNGRQYGYVTEDDTTEQTIIAPTNGSTVTSTIDVNIQRIVEEKIDYMWEALSDGPYGHDGAANIGVIVANPNNGEILAMGSSQPYDLNNPRDLTLWYTEEELELMSEESMLENLQKKWANFCISSAIEPGSTFKPMTVAAALNSAAISEDDEFVCDGFQVYGDTTIKCNVYPHSHGEQTLADTLKNSCNDGLMQMADAMGGTEFLRYQRMFGFGARTGIDLPGETAGVIFTEASLGSTERASSSFGQGFTCSMVQELVAFSSTINGGYLYRPTIMKQITSESGAVEETNTPEILRQVVSEEVSDKVRTYLGTVVRNDGTGKNAKVNGYSMGGKTGTAQKMGSRNKGKYLVSFIGFAPLENPQVVVYCVVDEANGIGGQADSRYPQWLAKVILQDLLPYMNIFPDEEEVTVPAAVRKMEENMIYLYNAAQQRKAENLLEEMRQAAMQAGQTVFTDEAGNLVFVDENGKVTQRVPQENTGQTAGDTTAEGTTGEPAGEDQQQGTTGVAGQPLTPLQQEVQTDMDPVADNTELATPPPTTEKITGGETREDGGITNDTLNPN